MEVEKESNNKAEIPDVQKVRQPSLVSKKININYISIGGIVLACLVLFGGGGFYLGKQSETLVQGSDKLLMTPTLTPTQTMTPTPTAYPLSGLWENNQINHGEILTTNDWRGSFEFVENSNIKFSINYPQHWTKNYTVFSSEGTKVAE